ncbi:MAG: class II aldolase/adducin family protein [Clostridiales bacterium]|jgi:L-fuculose-phosphate aldolase|nr:class II aldolase/adducin family protein [Clostridiales bacterium]
MTSAFEIKKEMCDIGRRIYQNGFVAANDGNFSVKVNANEFYCTPTGVSKGFMTPDMILKLDGKGSLLEPNSKYRPSSEFKMHLGVYRNRPDVTAVVHAHPPVATAHAVCGKALDTMIMPEVIIFLGEVPLTKYGTPSTEEIPDAIQDAIQNHDAVLLENHGALSVGVNLTQAYFRMETLEYWAKINLYTQQLGGRNELNGNQVARLLQIRREMKLPGRHPGCAACKNNGTAACHSNTGIAASCGQQAAAAAASSMPAAQSAPEISISEEDIRTVTLEVLKALGR